MKRRKAVLTTAATASLVIALAGGCNTSSSDVAVPPLNATAIAPDAAGATPGTLIEAGKLTRAKAPDGAARAEQLTYWSTGPQDKPVKVTGRFFLPKGQPPAGGWPVVSWHHPTVGIAAACTPSNTGYDDDNNPLLAQWLSHGYAVVATDYVTLGDPGVAPYLDGHTEAHNAIDIVRAARSAEPGLANRWVAVGHSQGAHAALFTAAVAADYAPELDLRATISMAPPTHVTEQLTTFGRPDAPADAGGPGFTPLGAYMIRGLAVAQPTFDPGAYLNAKGREVIDQAGRLCLPDMFERAGETPFASLLTKPLGEGDFTTLATPVFEVPTTGYRAPVLIAQGLADDTVDPPATKRTATELTDAGQPITYREYPGADHVKIVEAAASDAIAFADSNLRR
ncbi:lipase family protein [Nocardia sp. CDC159]|uniref:Lipase family protein n=1 Tax=Nocardia pulmonis TaxID=2951408 RepID=A0A9X2IWW3_9NOCA|nr:MULTISPECIES: lipase family protein [Nocardia]MCM6775372.1 lipase family protein [Nocardia pulmonis]MCM6787894.1 lipase family protein [Nocardia sp. CDC159]